MAICVNCRAQMYIQDGGVGVAIIWMFLNPPQPYRIAWGDVSTCPRCGQKVIDGKTINGLTEHYQAKFLYYVYPAIEHGSPIYIFEHPGDLFDRAKWLEENKEAYAKAKAE